ncbi:hypothetical protein SS50377_25424 [Spironucleus salmonicida]|uniref:Uncharacterized protein n=1 Tax=Spironucleus salmonicida TaxID=348837 RepID=V6LK22_9EUKA|nr:hypothetical protein SS50377_25424 [Spironucleus salmonicida]|eukprot:EST44970.1 Hypothetical protein SS50377_14988 [Spironucleus salmonicida]
MINTLQSQTQDVYPQHLRNGYNILTEHNNIHLKTNTASSLFLSNEFEVETHHHACIYKNANPLTTLTEDICMKKGIDGTFIPKKKKQVHLYTLHSTKQLNQQMQQRTQPNSKYKSNSIGNYLQFRRTQHNTVGYVDGKVYLASNTIGFIGK